MNGLFQCRRITPDPSPTSNSIRLSVPVQKPCDSDCHRADSSGSTWFGGWAVQIPCRSSSRSRLSGWFVKLVRCTFVLRVARATSGFGFQIPRLQQSRQAIACGRLWDLPRLSRAGQQQEGDILTVAQFLHERVTINPTLHQVLDQQRTIRQVQRDLGGRVEEVVGRPKQPATGARTQIALAARLRSGAGSMRRAIRPESATPRAELPSACRTEAHKIVVGG
jgi:hypothetical protein